MHSKLLSFLWLASLLVACSEAPLFSSDSNARLNYPVSMGLIPGTDLAVVVSADANLNQGEGSLVAVDLAERKLLLKTKRTVPNFSGRIWVDEATKRLYLTNKDREAVLVYSYQVPGSDGEAISFEEVSVSSPQKDTTNGLRTDETPFDVTLVSGTNRGNLLFSTNITTGSVSVLDPDQLKALDFNPWESKWTGLPLLSSANFQDRKKFPGVGAYRMALDPWDQRMLFVTSSQRNSIYVIDTYDQTIEAVLNLSFLSIATGVRGVALSTSKLAYLSSPQLNSVIILDVSSIANNGIEYEVVEPTVQAIIPVGRSPETVLLSADELTLYVLDQGEASLEMFDTTTLQLKSKTLLEGASVPSDLILHPTRGEIYSVNYISNDISVVDAATGAFLASIQ